MQIYDFVESERTFYETRHIPLMSGDDYSQYQLIKAINYARRSRYLDDNAKDDIIGDFPYDNISKYRIRLEARSTDFDIKHIEIEPVDSSDEARVSSMVSTKAIQKELREMQFGRFLNKYADTRPEYGAVLVKNVNDKLEIVPWENVITDMTDILTSPIIEKHYYTPAQLKKTGWDNLDLAIETANQKKKDKDIGRKADDTADTVGRFIEVYEVTGELSLASLLEAQDKEWKVEDENEFVLCRIIYAPMGKNEKDELEGVVLQAIEIDEKDYPYKLDIRHAQVGRAFGEGIPEELAEHQRWHNFYKTEEARAVAIGGKILFVTNDGNVVDSIYADGIDHGTILQVGDDKMFQQLTNMPNSVPVYQTIIQEWDASADKNSSSFDAVIGEESKAGTPFRAQYLQNVAGTSQFEREREDMGFFIVEIIEDWVLPRALEKAAKDDEIDTTFTKQELDLIDSVLVEKSVIQENVKQLIEQGQPVDQMSNDTLRQELGLQLKKRGTRRGIKGIKEFIKKAGKKVVVHTTDEQRNKAILFESYSNALMLFGETDPARLALRDRILDHMGVSAEELAMYAQEAAQLAQQQAQPVPSGNMNTQEMQKEGNLAANVQ